MAVGRHGGYRDNEFRDREADIGISRKVIRFPEGVCNRIRIGGDREHEKDWGWSRDDLHSKGRIRPKEMRERTVTDGLDGYQSTFGSSGSGPKSCNAVVSNMDREPGEVFSDGSEEGVHFEVKDNKGIELWKSENGDYMSHMHNKKRKFSPIVWDRDERDTNRTVKSKTISEANNLPCQPPLIIIDRQSPTFNPSCGEPPVPTDFREVDISEESPIGLSNKLLDSPSKRFSLPVWYNYQEPGEMNNDNLSTTRTIISSRWVNDVNSPADEGEISDKEYMPKCKRRFVSESAEAKGPRKSSSPELWEMKRESSDGTVGRSSLSDRQVRSSSRDSYHDTIDKNEDIEVDADPIRNYAGIGNHSETESEDDHGSGTTPEPAPQRSFDMLQGCRHVDEFERLNKIDEGTYGVVFRARDKMTGEVALKKVKMEKEREGFPLTSLREINILLSCHHPFIVDVKEVVVGTNLDSIFMVMEYMEHDLKGLIKTMKQPFSQSEVKCLMLQLIGGVKYLHDNWVLHRDLKTSNILLNNRGELKLCDFGLARQYGSPLKQYTQLVVTLWYRAPELFLGAKQYSTAIDMWSLGCIMAELLSKEPLFNGKTEVEQLDKIFKIIGTPTETIWPGFSELPGAKVNFVKHKYNLLRRKFPATSFTGSPVLSDTGFDLLKKLLAYDPDKRITAAEALNHPWFHEVPLPKSKELMLTFPAQHAQDSRMRRVMKSPDPLEEQMRKELQQGELGTGGLFCQ